MTVLLRFKDLKARGIVNSWMTLNRWVDNHNFPPGVKLGANTRAWTEESVEKWLAERSEAGRQEVA